MTIVKEICIARAVAAAGAILLSSALSLTAAHAQDKTYTMKMTLPTLNDPSYFYAKAYAAALEKDSGGRIKTDLIRLASSARSRGRSKARSSAPFSARSFRRSFSSASTSASK